MTQLEELKLILDRWRSLQDFADRSAAATPAHNEKVKSHFAGQRDGISLCVRDIEQLLKK